MEKRYIVLRQVAPTFYGVILNYIRTSKPDTGERVYSGEFIARTETWGVNEPVRAEILEPMGELTSVIFDGQQTNSDATVTTIHAYNSETAREFMNRRSREAFEAR